MLVSVWDVPREGVEDVRTNEDVKEHLARINQMMPVLDSNRPTTECAGCGTRIIDKYFLLVAEQRWHVPCLRCMDCNQQLDSQLTCFVRDGLIFCKEDYQRRYSGQCSRCHVSLSPQELVMRSREFIFHVHCFTCFSCKKPLTPGDTYGIHGDEIFCQDDYEHLLNNVNIENPDYCDDYQESFSTFVGHTGLLNFCSDQIGALQKGRHRKRKHTVLSTDGCFQHIGNSTNEHGELLSHDGYGVSQTPRQKRVRTSFKHHQLRTMKSYFALNHNPDGKDLKELSYKTQLSKRVLQVWFQNARAKYRRSVAKQGRDNPDNDVKDATNDASEQSLNHSKCRSPAMSDVSSNQSVASLDMDQSVTSMDMNQSVTSADINDVGNNSCDNIDNFTEMFSDDNTSS